MIHLSVAIARFIETLLWALVRAGMSLAGLAILGLGLVAAAGILIQRALRRSRKN